MNAENPVLVFTDTLASYDFGIWDFHVDKCDRWSINFLTFYGHEILDHLDLIRRTSDERAISAKICEVTGHRAQTLISTDYVVANCITRLWLW